MFRRALGLALAALCLAVPVTATETEADAIRAVVDEWIADEDSLNNAPYLAELDALYTTASPECRRYIDLAFSGIAIFDAANRYSTENRVGLENYTYVITPFAEREYACRIAI